MTQEKLERLSVIIKDAQGLLGGGSSNEGFDEDLESHLISYLESLKSTDQAHSDQEQKKALVKSFQEIVRVREQVREHGLISVDKLARENLEMLTQGKLPEEVFTRRSLFQEVVDKALADTAELFEDSVLTDILKQNEDTQAQVDHLRKELRDLEDARRALEEKTQQLASDLKQAQAETSVRWADSNSAGSKIRIGVISAITASIGGIFVATASAISLGAGSIVIVATVALVAAFFWEVLKKTASFRLHTDQTAQNIQMFYERLDSEKK